MADPNVGNWKLTTGSGWVQFAEKFTANSSTPTATVFCWRKDVGAGACDDITLHALQ